MASSSSLLKSGDLTRYFWAPDPSLIWVPTVVDQGWFEGKARDIIVAQLQNPKTKLPLQIVSINAVGPESGIGSSVRKREKDNTFTITPLPGTKLIEAEVRTLLPIDSPYVLTDFPDDFISLSEVNTATILHASKLRFSKKLIYTSCGDVLMAINPFETIAGMYSAERMALYNDVSQQRLPAHIYVIPARAYADMCAFGKSQCILISGESGAGKTEATKQCLGYLANIAGASTVALSEKNAGVGQRRKSILKGTSQAALGIANRVVAASPILEAFGNACTLRNPNSSRFGKWMELSFDNNNQITGSTITSYLLEVGRVTSASAGERNYHIFYQMLRGMPREHLLQLGVSPSCAAHRYLVFNSPESLTMPGKAVIVPKGVSGEAPDLKDAENYSELISAFDAMGIPYTAGNTGVDAQSLLQVIAGVLILGDVEFVAINDGEASAVQNEISEKAESLVDSSTYDTRSATGGTTAAKLLGVEPVFLRDALCSRKITSGARRSIVTVSLTPKRAGESRDSLARAIYGRVFTHVIASINEQNSHSAPVKAAASNLSSGKGKSIGLLDVFGFEIFQLNSFEQLCINYCNEQLQSHFNFVIFTSEMQMYAAEGIACNTISHRDNSGVIADIEMAFAALDEEARIPQGTSTTWFAKLAARCESVGGSSVRSGNGSSLYSNISVGSKRTAFVVKHYAGEVSYVPTAFLDKNTETLSQDLAGLMSTSAIPFLATLFSSANGVAAQDDESQRGKSRQKEKSVSGNFTAQLQSLLSLLR